MTMVDEFLDQLTEDYTALYNDNTILKNKLKVLSDSIEEYRATDVAMRKTLLAAQQMADSMVSDAEKKKTQLEQDATQEAQARKSKLEAEIAAEEFRLQQAQKATADYVMKLHALHQEELDYLSRLGQMVPPEMAQAAMAQSIVPEGPTTPVEDLTSEEEEVEEPTISQPLQQSQQPKNDPVDDLYLDATRRFDDLQFGKDYQIK
jgi:cell division initiation protein